MQEIRESQCDKISEKTREAAIQSLGGEIDLGKRKEGWKNGYRYKSLVCLVAGSLEILALMASIFFYKWKDKVMNKGVW